IASAHPSPAARLLKTYGQRCHVWNPLLLPKTDDPEALIDRGLLQPVLGEYLCTLESLVAGEPILAERLVSELLDLIEGDEIRFVTVLPLAGIRFHEDPIEEGDVRFRSLTAEELGYLGGGRHLEPPTVRRGAFPLRMFDVVFERWVLEVRRLCPKDRQPDAG